eukprot:756237-Hanusia_phi.AAC.3
MMTEAVPDAHSVTAMIQGAPECASCCTQYDFTPSPLPSPFPPATNRIISKNHPGPCENHLVSRLGECHFRNHHGHAENDSVCANRHPDDIAVATWNVAAVNNNPFEYWVTHPDPAYNALMEGVQNVIDHPEAHDIQVHEVLTDSMVEQLMNDLQRQKAPGIAEVKQLWQDDFRNRKIVSGFLKDNTIGKKRLASMPDRITNTINCVGGKTLKRPTVINYYEKDMGDRESWWSQWREFIFNTEVEVYSSGGNHAPKLVYSLLEPILHKKYPALSVEEERISLPLQVLCLAIFDAIQLHILNTVAPDSWQRIRRSLADALLINKDRQVASVLLSTYGSYEIVFVQEAAGAFVHGEPGNLLEEHYIPLLPSVMDGKRDQNSLILVKKDVFLASAAQNITDEVLQVHKKATESTPGAVLYPGDLAAYCIDATNGRKFLLASFHGDTNGLATVPIVRALHEVASTKYPERILIIGLDANTYKVHNDQYQGVSEFQGFLDENGLISCWGPTPNPYSPTTCNARTFLQPQLNKSAQAVRRDDRITKADKNLKDWIVFSLSQLECRCAHKDNTGSASYIEDMVFPTMNFPSDHAIVAATVSVKKGQA